ncbi:unnamed protein product [Ostreobium quekettii]|uniref:BTB domain-containing protein n=1 Tax=Ostreobium quekettii TaxID=121088 RepID=A0A8S1IQ40_9CHLO|nr:unnamed protein product [Ostreobium quekettii]|eukprot:evm.model.scf_1196.1 EVM.evm.TU.scf_1196.1   scf_1196:17193-18314(+)
MTEAMQEDLQYMPEDAEYANLCDISLIAQGQGIPAHGAVIALHSRFFCKMLSDLKGGDSSTVDGMLRVTLDDSVSAEDTRLMLAIMYGQILKLNSLKQAWTALSLGDKYDAKILIRVSEQAICELGDSFYFVKPREPSGSALQPGQTQEWHDAAKWLGLADCLGMESLRKKCQCVILRSLVAHSSASPIKAELLSAMASLHDRGVAAESISSMLGALARLGPHIWPAGSSDMYCGSFSTHTPFGCGSFSQRTHTPLGDDEICQALKEFQISKCGHQQ